MSLILKESTKKALRDLAQLWPDLTEEELINQAIQQAWARLWAAHASPRYIPTCKITGAGE